MITAPLKNRIRQTSLRWHNRMGWWATTALLIWGLSAIAHPLMSWTGPMAAKFFAPTLPTLTSAQLQQVDDVLKHSSLTTARVIKIVPSQYGAVLQVTTDQQQPRRYFALTTQQHLANEQALTNKHELANKQELASGQEILNQDEQQARWLATYYSGRADGDIRSVERITEFDSSYPWVNRLLPVYRVQFTGDDQLTAFIHTETAALASLSNNTKHSMQSFFQALHTFSWLDAAGSGRVIIMALLIFCLIAMALTGLGMVTLIRRRKIADGKRHWHRLAGYVLWLPLLAWSASGFYHLLQSAYAAPPTGMALGPVLSIDELNAAINTSTLSSNALNAIESGNIQSVSLVHGNNNNLLYRVSVAPVVSGDVSREQKFTGQSTEAKAIYIDIRTGNISPTTDEQQARFLATALGANTNNIAKVSQVTHFSPDYDFRNKRLPVWQIDLQGAEQRHMFVDTTTGILVDQNRSVDRIEGWSFSVLHKWNHLVPLTGRFYRDVLIVITLISLLISGGLGAWMLWSRQATERKRRARSAALQDA